MTIFNDKYRKTFIRKQISCLSNQGHQINFIILTYLQSHLHQSTDYLTLQDVNLRKKLT